MDALDLLAATSWGDERPSAAPRPHTPRVRGVRPLDRLADAIGDLARAAPALSDGAARVTTAYGVPSGGRDDQPPRGLVRRCGTRLRAEDAEVRVACRDTFEQASLLVHADPVRRGHAVAA